MVNVNVNDVGGRTWECRERMCIPRGHIHMYVYKILVWLSVCVLEVLYIQ